MATEPDKLNVGAIATMTIILALAVLAVVGGVTALVRVEVAADVARKGGAANLGPINDLKATQSAGLAAPPRWVDQGKGQLALPIDLAMRVVVAEVAADGRRATALPASAAAPTASAVPPAGSTDVAGDGAAAPPSGSAEAAGSASAGPAAPSKPRPPTTGAEPAPAPPAGDSGKN